MVSVRKTRKRGAGEKLDGGDFSPVGSVIALAVVTLVLIAL